MCVFKPEEVITGVVSGNPRRKVSSSEVLKRLQINELLVYVHTLTKDKNPWDTLHNSNGY